MTRSRGKREKRDRETGRRGEERRVRGDRLEPGSPPPASNQLQEKQGEAGGSLQTHGVYFFDEQWIDRSVSWVSAIQK